MAVYAGLSLPMESKREGNGQKGKYIVWLEMPPQAPLERYRWRGRVRRAGETGEVTLEAAEAYWSWYECALAGAIALLSSIPEGGAVVFRCPSKPIYLGMMIWVQYWMRNGWVTSKGTEVRGRPLWEKLIALSSVRKVMWWPTDEPPAPGLGPLARMAARRVQARGRSNRSM